MRLPHCSGCISTRLRLSRAALLLVANVCLHPFLTMIPRHLGRANWKFTQWCGSDAKKNTWEGYAVGKDSRCKPSDGPPNCRPTDEWEMNNFMPLPTAEAVEFHGTQCAS